MARKFLCRSVVCMFDYISPPVVILEEIQRTKFDEKYRKYKLSRIKNRLKKLEQFFSISEDNTFIILRRWNEYWNPFSRLEDLKVVAELQAEFSKYIILPRSPVPVHEVWRAVDFDPVDYIWIKDSWAPGCENCIHTNLQTGRCASKVKGSNCPDFFKYTAVDMLVDIAKSLEVMARNATLVSVTGGNGVAGKMFAESLSLLDKKVFEQGELVKELLRKYVVEFGYVEGDQ